MDTYIANYQAGFQEGQLRTLQISLSAIRARIADTIALICDEPDRAWELLQWILWDLDRNISNADPELWKKVREAQCIAPIQDDAHD